MKATLKGAPELMALLRKTPEKIQRNVMRGAMRAAAKVVAEEAKVRVPVKTGKLRASIKYGARLHGDVVVGKVNTRGKGAFVAPFIEFGATAHLISARGRKGDDRAAIVRANKAAKRKGLRIGGKFVGAAVQHPGIVAKPFMRPALDAKIDEAVLAMGQYIRARLTAQGVTVGDEKDDDI